MEEAKLLVESFVAMKYLDHISKYIEQERDLLGSIDTCQIRDAIKIIEKARVDGKHIFVMGNGGSSTTASHFCCDFNNAVHKNVHPKFKFICLNDNIPTMLAYANDMSFDDIFVLQLKNLLEQGDVIIGISSRGNSTNVVRALQWGKQNGAITIALTGFDGGLCREIADCEINIPSNNIQHVEDLHIMLNHCMLSAFFSFCE